MTAPYQYSINGSPVNPIDINEANITLSANITLVWAFASVDSPNVVARYMRVSATTTSLTITMPTALQATQGYSFIINNVGANTFTLLDSTGATIAAVASGTIKWIALYDNTTAAGSWDTVAFGVGTSSVNASSLQGYGLITFSTTLNENHPYVAENSNFSVVPSSRASFYNWTGGAGTATFNDAVTLGNGFSALFRNNGTGALTLAPDPSDLINGLTNIALNPGDSCIVFSSGSTDLFTVGLGKSNVYIFTRLVKNVAGNANVTLTTAEVANKIINFTGILTGNITVNFPPTADVYFLKNSTTGNFTLTVQPTGGTGVSSVQGLAQIVASDGSTMYYADSIVAVLPFTNKGDILTYNGSSTQVLPIGVNNQVLTADSTKSNGLAWETPSGFNVLLSENFA